MCEVRNNLFRQNNCNRTKSWMWRFSFHQVRWSSRQLAHFMETILHLLMLSPAAVKYFCRGSYPCGRQIITSSYPGWIKSPHVVTRHTVSHWEDLPKFQFSGGGGGIFWNWKVTKCQDLPKFQFSGGGGGVFWNWKVTKCQDLPKFQFWGEGGILKLKSDKVPRSA